MNAILVANVENMWLLAGWTMIHFLWLGTLVALAALVSRWLLRRTSANVRYVVALTCLAMLAAMPIAIAMWLHEYSPSVQVADQPLQNDAASRIVELKDIEPTAPNMPPAIAKGDMPMTVGPEQQAAPPSGTTIAVPTPAIVAPSTTDPLALAVFAIDRSVQYLPWLWLIGTPLTFAFTATGLIGTRRLRRASRPITDGPIAETLAQLVASLHLTRRVVVTVCDRIAAPVLIGILRPIILLPPAALTGYSPDEIEMVLLHELAHVHRWDNLVNLIQRVVESLLFFHPAVWLISSWARRERETCCDALVVARTDHPHAYAELLVALAAQMPRSVLFHPAASSAMAAGPLRSRIRRILQLDDDPMLISGKSFTLMLAALLVAITLAVLYLPSVGQAEQAEAKAKQNPDVATPEKKNVLDKEKTEGLESRDKLQKELQELQGEIKRKYQDYLAIAKDMNRATTDIRDPEIDLLIREIADGQKKVEDLTSEYYQLQTDYMIAKRELSDPKLLEGQAEEALKRDSQYADLLQKANAQTAPSDGSEYQAVEKYRADFKKKAVREMQSKPSIPLQQLIQRFKTQSDSMQKQISLVTQNGEQKKKEVEKRLEKSVDLERRGVELTKLQQAANEMNVKLESLNIDGDELEPLVFELKSNGAGQTEILLNGNRTTEDSIRKLLRERVASNIDQPVSLTADKSIKYAEVMKVVDLLESLGIKKLALDTRSVGENGTSSDVGKLKSLFKQDNNNPNETKTYKLPAKLEAIFPELPVLIESLKADPSHPDFSYNLQMSGKFFEVHAPKQAQDWFQQRISAWQNRAPDQSTNTTVANEGDRGQRIRAHMDWLLSVNEFNPVQTRIYEIPANVAKDVRPGIDGLRTQPFWKSEYIFEATWDDDSTKVAIRTTKTFHEYLAEQLKPAEQDSGSYQMTLHAPPDVKSSPDRRSTSNSSTAVQRLDAVPRPPANLLASPASAERSVLVHEDATQTLDAALKAKQDALIKRQQAQGQEAIEASKRELEKANRQLEDVKRSLEKEIHSAETGNSNAQPTLDIKPVAVESSSGPASESASPEELEILRERAKIAEDQFKKNDEQYKTGGRGGSKDRREVAAYELALAQANLAMAEGKRGEALAKLIECQALAEEAYKAVVSSYDAGRVSYDFLRTESNRLSEIKLKVARLKGQKSPFSSTESKSSNPYTVQPHPSVATPNNTLTLSASFPATPSMTPDQPAPVPAPKPERSLLQTQLEQMEKLVEVGANSAADRDKWIQQRKAAAEQMMEAASASANVAAKAKEDALARRKDAKDDKVIEVAKRQLEVADRQFEEAHREFESAARQLAELKQFVDSRRQNEQKSPNAQVEPPVKVGNTNSWSVIVNDSADSKASNQVQPSSPKQEKKTTAPGTVVVPNVEQVKVADHSPASPIVDHDPKPDKKPAPTTRVRERSWRQKSQSNQVIVAYEIPKDLVRDVPRFGNRGDLRTTWDEHGRYIVQADQEWHDRFKRLLEDAPKWRYPAARHERAQHPIVMTRKDGESRLEWRGTGLTFKDDPNPEPAQHRGFNGPGVVVADVAPGSPANWDDIRIGDQIAEAGRFRVTNISELNSLFKTMEEGFQNTTRVPIKFERYSETNGYQGFQVDYTLRPDDPDPNGPELHKEKPTASGTGPGAAPAKPTTQLPGNSPAKQLATSRLDLRYDGKTFGQWQNAWQTELSTDKRIEAVKALAAFGRAGYGKEAAVAILDVAGEYDFNTIESDGEGKLKEAVLDQLAPDSRPQSMAKYWVPELAARLEKDPQKWRWLAGNLFDRLKEGDDRAISVLQTLSRSGPQDIRIDALVGLVTSVHERSKDGRLDDKTRALLSHALQSKDKSEVQMAISLLLHYTPSATTGAPEPKLVFQPELLPLLFHNDEEIRRRARGVLRYIEEQDAPAAVKELVAVLNDKSRQRDHIEAVRGLAAVGKQANNAAPELVQLFKNTPDLNTFVAIYVALARCEGIENVESYADAIRKHISDDELQRIAAKVKVPSPVETNAKIDDERKNLLPPDGPRSGGGGVF